MSGIYTLAIFYLAKEHDIVELSLIPINENDTGDVSRISTNGADYVKPLPSENF